MYSKVVSKLWKEKSLQSLISFVIFNPGQSILVILTLSLKVESHLAIVAKVSFRSKNTGKRDVNSAK